MSQNQDELVGFRIEWVLPPLTPEDASRVSEPLMTLFEGMLTPILEEVLRLRGRVQELERQLDSRENYELEMRRERDE